MDARKMKKIILFAALDKWSGSFFDEIAVTIFDKNEDELTQAEIKRYEKVFSQMLRNAESKV